MSWDLVVYTTEKPNLEVAAEALGLTVQLHDDAFTVARLRNGRQEPAFEGDGPMRVKRDDLPAPVATAGVGLRLAFGLSVPAAAPDSLRELAGRMARRTADDANGVVYDPQTDRITWPRSSRRQLRLPAVERIAVVRLEWFLADQLADAAFSQFLDVVTDWWHEALPRRFGDFEPLQHEWQKEGTEGLIRLARQEGTVLWSSSRPFFGGSLSVEPHDDDPESDARQDRDFQSAPIAKLSLDLDGRIASTLWRADVIDGFVEAAEKMDCIYAHAQVEKGWGRQGGQLWADDRTESRREQVRDRRGLWLGLPSDPVWLAWLGTPYAALSAGTPAGRGRLVVIGQQAAGADSPPEGPLPVAADWTTNGYRPAKRLPSLSGVGRT